jgi:hypothetical protein
MARNLVGDAEKTIVSSSLVLSAAILANERPQNARASSIAALAFGGSKPIFAIDATPESARVC